MSKSLTEWLSEMERLDKEAKEGLLFEAHALSDTGDWYETREMLIENYDAHLKKILNEDGGEG